MQQPPFLHVRQGALWKISINFARAYIDRSFMVTVYRVKMRWRVVAVVHRNDDTQEAAKFWHRQSLPPQSSVA
jgi:hypothetical protein